MRMSLTALLLLVACGGAGRDTPPGGDGGAVDSPQADTSTLSDTSPEPAPAGEDTSAAAPSGDTAARQQAQRPAEKPAARATKPAPAPKPAAPTPPAEKPPAEKPAAEPAAPATPTPSPTAQDTGAGGDTASGTTETATAPLRDQYHQAPKDTVDQATYDGWKQYNLNCARCHGEDVLGSTIAPHLVASLKPDGPINTQEAFVQVVCAGRPEKGMPSWCALGMEPAKINQIYSYVKGRSEGKIRPGRPALREGG
jgi:hypothetical protein